MAKITKTEEPKEKRAVVEGLHFTNLTRACMFVVAPRVL